MPNWLIGALIFWGIISTMIAQVYALSRIPRFEFCWKEWTWGMVILSIVCLPGTLIVLFSICIGECVSTVAIAICEFFDKPIFKH